MKALLFFIATTSTAFAQNCPEQIGKYGNGIQYQDMFCRIMVGADRKDSQSYRNLTFTDSGAIQVFSNFPGTTNSNSTGARVFYLFPKRTKKAISSSEESGMSLTHSSGATFKFDKNGRVSSPDMAIKVANDINSQNKSGIEIESYSKGIVIDIGYRMGSTPLTKKDGVVTVTDKNKKKCTMINSDLHRFVGGEAELIYKNNDALHGFLSKKCPGLDLSDLIKPMAQDLKVVKAPAQLGQAPSKDFSGVENDSKRERKPQVDELDSLIKNLDSKSSQK